MEQAANKAHSNVYAPGIWPGDTFQPDKEKFSALLGTPLGKGIAFLLAQHPNMFPKKKVASMTIFVSESSDEDSLLTDWHDDDSDMDGMTMQPDYHLLFSLTD